MQKLLISIATAYLGCLRPGAAPAHSWRNCTAACPTVLTGIVGSKCVCVPALPPASAVNAGTSAVVCSKRGGIAVYHTHGGVRCRLQDVPLLSNGTFVAYNPDRVSYMSANRTMRLVMDGNGKGTRVAANRAFAYGSFQVDALVDPTRGVVSAFYLRSDLMQETRDFSEIDVEFLNGPPAKLPGSVWLNSWRDGNSNGVTLLPVLNKNVYGTYTISWTPSGIAWYVNGRLVQRSAKAIPNKPSYVTFSIWTSTPPHGNGDFGGVLPKSGGAATYYSWFAAHRRVVCERFPLVSRRVVPTPH